MAVGSPYPFGERSRPIGRIAHQKHMEAICRADETQSPEGP
jgi:hypothetical protein